ncbi:hypothetical protein PHLCEN_2v12889 [Hermanssonia centrifuga]|uniref:Uncharacterized protein n=1 Tax=Hermanssonia centrifuga TaxID=98765 RepID=A0A2R6NFR9_9APHY|nr:hypothetical protein PHLCEN_2v12889 [Hermanssonia centrifuga]
MVSPAPTPLGMAVGKWALGPISDKPRHIEDGGTVDSEDSVRSGYRNGRSKLVWTWRGLIEIPELGVVLSRPRHEHQRGDHRNKWSGYTRKFWTTDTGPNAQNVGKCRLMGTEHRTAHFQAHNPSRNFAARVLEQICQARLTQPATTTIVNPTSLAVVPSNARLTAAKPVVAVYP